jgi:hypothetical protein
MTTFTGTSGNDVANATTGTISGFAGWITMYCLSSVVTTEAGSMESINVYDARGTRCGHFAQMFELQFGHEVGGRGFGPLPAGLGAHRHLTVRQLSPHTLDVHRGRVGHADRDVHEHAPAALADIREERQARVPDGIGDGSARRRRAIPPVDVDTHSELENKGLCAHVFLLLPGSFGLE